MFQFFLTECSLLNKKNRRLKMADPKDMYQCQVSNCGYVYDPDKGEPKTNTPAGTAFKDLPEDWVCPFCGSSAKTFRPLAGPGSVLAEG
jgi:rubredoxin